MRERASHVTAKEDTECMSEIGKRKKIVDIRECEVLANIENIKSIINVIHIFAKHNAIISFYDEKEMKKDPIQYTRHSNNVASTFRQ